MQDTIFLRKYQYSMRGHPLIVPVLPPASAHTLPDKLPLLKLDLDFERGQVSFHDSQVAIDGILFPAEAIYLEEGESNGLVFPIEGHITDSTRLSACSGLIIVEKSSLQSPEWFIHIYLYKLEFSTEELHFCIPLYLRRAANRFN
jgi:hypothetical protein